MNISLRSQKGLGLIETLMIVLFISISIVALFRFQHYLSLSTHHAQQQNDALIIATKQIETLRDFSVVSTTASYFAYQDIATGSSTSTQNGTAYTTSWTITANTNPSYKTLDVTVTWTDRSNVSRSVRLISRVSNLDPAVSSLVF